MTAKPRHPVCACGHAAHMHRNPGWRCDCGRCREYWPLAPDEDAPQAPEPPAQGLRLIQGGLSHDLAPAPAARPVCSVCGLDKGGPDARLTIHPETLRLIHVACRPTGEDGGS